MKWLLYGSLFLMFNYVMWCQDIVFPDDEELSHLSGNKKVISERIPVSIPGQCPKNMLLYPGDSSNSTWICDCRPRFLYFPLNDSCFEAYKQGPCRKHYYVVLNEERAVPQCVPNPCMEDGLVRYNNTCYALRTIGGPCDPDGVLGVNETTFTVECVPTEIAPFIIIQAPKRQCPAGSRRNALGICKKPI
ncbi:uncharacterized protein [Prorops nasuta]|uniref:uncharacterized protein n=1 Tax=Prorops nasuta TaxID=863751 RepID=UPI0034CD9D34